MISSFATQTLPRPLRGLAYRAFARAVGANLEEVELELGAYPSLGDFFARKLRDGARTIDRAPDSIIAPCDGVIAALGTCVDGSLLQAKGRNYRLGELLADDGQAARFSGGAYATIYLSPRDYHRVHAPAAARVLSYEYVPGTLWPVNPKVAARRDRLLARNERVVIQLDAGPLGHVAVVMVGASGVGNIRLIHAPDSTVFRGSGERHRIEFADVAVRRGDELGGFRLGSTVVMVFEPARATLLGGVGQPVRFGERMGCMTSREEPGE